MSKNETDEEKRKRIYPIILCEYNPEWPFWYEDEKTNIVNLIGTKNIFRISHIGSTAIPGMTAKPTVDILLEINKTTDTGRLKKIFASPDYICLYGSELTMPTSPPHLIILKGYLPNGFAAKVFHIHVRYPNDWDELRFVKYLTDNPSAAAEYMSLKERLIQEYKHDRDGYTRAKEQFVSNINLKSKEGVV
ncbi:MAG: GrpB family protein [Defluviitaleaceae bacterium]|nr:GrpB family protein [Defluviitaleaceae bacterium]